MNLDNHNRKAFPSIPRFIKSHATPLLTEAEVQQVIGQIAEGRLKPSLKTHVQHARHVKEIVAAKEAAQPSGAKACPKCGSTMVYDG